MNNLKKLAALLISGAVLAGSAFSAFAAEFSDMPDGEMGVAIENAVNNGLLTGYEDGTVKPYDPITRAQMSAIIVRAFGATEKTASDFADVPADAWYKESVEQAVYMGAFEGDENGNFNPDNNITFQETYTVLARVFQFVSRDITVSPRVESSVEETLAEYSRITDAAHTEQTDENGTTYVTIKGKLCNPSDSVLDAFADKDQVASWALDYTKAVVGNGGYAGIDGLLKPTASISRGEFAMVMDQLVSLYIDEPGTYNTGFGSGSVIVRSGGVTIDGLNTDHNLILSYGIDSETSVTNSTIGNCLVIYGGSDKTPVENSNGDLRADESYISISANLYDCRIFAPYSETAISWTNENPREVFIKSYPNTAVVNLGFMQ